MKNDKKWLKESVNELKTIFNGKKMGEYETGRLDGYSHVSMLIDHLDEPEKPVIPQFVADFIRATKPSNSLRLAFEYIAQRKIDNYDDELALWIEEGNSELFARAWLDGYEVEKEKLYTVDLPHSYELIKLLHTQTYTIKKYSESGFGDYTNTFTEAEIKKIDERLMVFAEEVMG